MPPRGTADGKTNRIDGRLDRPGTRLGERLSSRRQVMQRHSNRGVEPTPIQNSEFSHPIDRIVLAYFAAHKVSRQPLDDGPSCAGLISTSLACCRRLANSKSSSTIKSDKRSRLIDRLLNQSAYAEHWLTFWNDLLRNDYQGTGYIDGGRKPISVWLYQSLWRTNPMTGSFAN